MKKTTVEIAEPLLEEAKAAARREGTTLRDLVERGLRSVLAERRGAQKTVLRDERFRGRGLQKPLAQSDWGAVRDAIYKGRGT